MVCPCPTEWSGLADRQVEADVKDVDRIAASIQQNKINPIFVTSDQADVTPYPVAKLSTIFGLPGNKPESVEVFSHDKSKMYQFASDQGIPVPPFRRAASVDDVLDFIKAHGLPVVIKPADCSSTKGFAIINRQNLDKLPELIRNCLSFSFWKLNYFIVQKYVTGLEITVEGVCSGGKHRSLTTSRKVHFRPGVASSLDYPSNLSEPLLRRVCEANDRFVHYSGLNLGITHAEYMIDGDNFWLIEIAARGGGLGISSRVVPLVTGVVPYDILYKSLCSKTVDLNNLQVAQNPTRLQFFEFDNREKLPPIESVLEIPGVNYFTYNQRLYGNFRPAMSGSDRHAMGVFTGETQSEIDKSIAKAKSLLI